MASSGPGTAFEFWKDGTRQFPINTQSEFNTAVRQFKNAMKADDTFARAYGWLAYSYVVSVADGWSLPKAEQSWETDQVFEEAVRLADRAIALNPEDYDNYWARGYVRLHCRKWSQSKKDFDKARVWNNGNRDLLVENADQCVYNGDPDKAIELIRRACRVPDWYHWTMAWACYFKGKKDPLYYDTALEELAKLREPPGQGKSPAEICIVWAAIYGQKAINEKDPHKKAEFQKKAEENRKAFEKLRGKRSLDELDHTNPFRRRGDRDHWLRGLKQAKF